MKIWIGVTDNEWFEFLRAREPDEVNFWQPSGSREFRVLQAGEPFLFKLHSPRNYIVGGGFFVRYSPLPCSLAWQAFGEKNGVDDLPSLLARIRKYRRTERIEPNLTIGCSILTEPFFWPEDNWIDIPADWARNIVRGKSYTTNQEVGANLWEAVRIRLAAKPGQFAIAEQDEAPRYGADYLARARLGQGAFRVLVTEAYEKRCSITGERTLPVLEAAHIQPFSEQGPNLVRNGLLLRSDLHILFDRGYITIEPDYRVHVSKRIREEFENGRDYYAHHGKPLLILPRAKNEQPAPDLLRWHNDHVFGSNG